MTEQPSDRCYSQISFDSFSKGKNPGIAYASDEAFFQKALGERFASSGSFCPLRFCVNIPN